MPNHVYPAAGIKINTPGYALGNFGLNCASSDNGYCLFSVSNTQPANISISKSSGYVISGTISNLTAIGLVLQNNGADNLTVTNGATSFQFSTPVAFGGSYNVTVYQQPTGLTCTVSHGSGNHVMANVTTISISCNQEPTISSVSPNIGSTGGGTSVTITGTSLSNTTSVSFGGVAATITETTSTAVTVTAPSGTAGAVNVEVLTTDGSTTDNSAYTYVTPGTATSLAHVSGNLVFSGSALNWLGGSGSSYRVYYMNAQNTPPTGGQAIPSGFVSVVSGKTFIVSDSIFMVVNQFINPGYYMFICDTATSVDGAKNPLIDGAGR